jgi:hypothetical protein
MKRDSSTRVLAIAVRQYYKNAAKTEIVATMMVLLGVLNFVAFMAFCMNVGGSAGNGGIRNGRYFVSEHGKEAEVSSLTFKLNQTHGRSLWITHPMAVLGMLILVASSRAVQGRSDQNSTAEQDSGGNGG